MRETTIRLHSFLVMDAKAREQALNAMARSGWALTRIYGNLFARFTRTERTDLTYFVDWSDPNEPDGAYYRRLCADAGWEPVQKLGFETVYASRPGLRPAPIQTDPALEYQRFQGKVLRRMALACVPALFFLLLVLLVALLRPENLRGLLLGFALEANVLAILLVTAPVTLPALAVYLADGAHHLRLWRRAAEAGEPLAPPAPGLIRLGAVLHALARLMWFLTALCLAADLLLNAYISMLHLVLFTFAACLGVVRRGGMEELQRQFISVLAVFLVCGFLTWAHGPLREVWPGRVPAGPVVETFEVRRDERTDTFLGSRAEWREAPPQEPGDTDVSSTYLRVSADAWSLPLLAGLVREPVPRDYRPVEGLEGAWQLTERSDEGVWHCSLLLRREDREVHLQYYGEEPAFDLTALALRVVESNPVRL